MGDTIEVGSKFHTAAAVREALGLRRSPHTIAPVAQDALSYRYCTALRHGLDGTGLQLRSWDQVPALMWEVAENRALGFDDFLIVESSQEPRRWSHTMALRKNAHAVRLSAGDGWIDHEDALQPHLAWGTGVALMIIKNWVTGAWIEAATPPPPASSGFSHVA